MRRLLGFLVLAFLFATVGRADEDLKKQVDAALKRFYADRLNQPFLRFRNPLTELVGPLNWYNEKQPRPKGLELTLKDIPRLSKHLREDQFQLIVSFWRDFAPDRSLSSTRPEIAGIINGLARRDLCQIKKWADLSPEGINKEIERINRWAVANAGKTSRQLEIEVLNDEIAAGADWDRIEGRVESLLEQKEPTAFDTLKRFLEAEKTTDWQRTQILGLYLRSDPTRATKLASKYLDAKNLSLRGTAALIVFQTGDRARARQILGDQIATGSLEGVVSQAVDALLKEGARESLEQVARLFKNPDLVRSHAFGTPSLLRRCAAAGLKEPYAHYLKLLANNDREIPYLDKQGKRTGAAFFEPSVAQHFAREIVESFAGDDPAVREIAKKFPKTADRVEPLRKWLESKLPPK